MLVKKKKYKNVLICEAVWTRGLSCSVCCPCSRGLVLCAPWVEKPKIWVYSWRSARAAPGDGPLLAGTRRILLFAPRRPGDPSLLGAPPVEMMPPWLTIMGSGRIDGRQEKGPSHRCSSSRIRRWRQERPEEEDACSSSSALTAEEHGRTVGSERCRPTPPGTTTRKTSVCGPVYASFPRSTSLGS